MLPNDLRGSLTFADTGAEASEATSQHGPASATTWSGFLPPHLRQTGQLSYGSPKIQGKPRSPSIASTSTAGQTYQTATTGRVSKVGYSLCIINGLVNESYQTPANSKFAKIKGGRGIVQPLPVEYGVTRQAPEDSSSDDSDGPKM